MSLSVKVRAVSGSFGIALCAAILACGALGCSSFYDKTLHRMALPSDELLAARVTEMMGSGEHAIRALEAAGQWYVESGGESPAPSDVHLRVVVNDAEAEVFEFSRRVLSVEDVAAASAPESGPHVERLRVSMAACQSSLGVALAVVRAWINDTTHITDATTMQESSPLNVARAIELAKIDIDALRADAATFMSR